jgi:hypothetical protein
MQNPLSLFIDYESIYIYKIPIKNDTSSKITLYPNLVNIAQNIVNDNKVNDNKVNDNKVNDNKVNDNIVNDNIVNDTTNTTNQVNDTTEIKIIRKLSSNNMQNNIDIEECCRCMIL